MTAPLNAPDYVKHEGLKNGSPRLPPDPARTASSGQTGKEEYDRLCAEMVQAGT